MSFTNFPTVLEHILYHEREVVDLSDEPWLHSLSTKDAILPNDLEAHIHFWKMTCRWFPILLQKKITHSQCVAQFDIDVYPSTPSAKDLGRSLETKYETEEAGNRMSIILFYFSILR